MSVGPEALRRFGSPAVSRVPHGAGLLCAPHGCSGLLCAPHGCSGCRRARPPARLGVLTAFGAASRGPPWPSGPSGTLHTSGAVVADIARRVVSKPGQTPPPPTSTTARPTNSSGTLHTSGVCPFCVYPIQAPPPPTSAAARPTNSSRTLHTSGAVVADVARRVVSKPGQAPPPPTSTTAGPSVCSVLSTPVAVDFTELGAGCRRAGVLMMQNSRLVVVKPRREAVWRSKCRPPRSKTLKTGC